MREPTKLKTTEEVKIIEGKDLFYFIGGDWKPWWSTCNKGKLEEHGTNSIHDVFSFLLDDKLMELTENGGIVKKDKDGNTQWDLIEAQAKITKLKEVGE